MKTTSSSPISRYPLVIHGRSIAAAAVLLCIAAFSNPANAQEVRYSWFELGVLGTDIQKEGSQFDLALNQSVNIDATDGTGVRFKGSLGTWRGFFASFNFDTSDPDVSAVVINNQGTFPAEDSFDYTALRAGIGYRWELTYKTHLTGEIIYDSVDFDFGSFAGEDFDVDDSDFGATVAVRSMFNDDLELRAHARYTNLGDVNLTTRTFDSDVLFGVGLGWQLIRGLSVTLDYETGQVESFSIGMRLDLDED